MFTCIHLHICILIDIHAGLFGCMMLILHTPYPEAMIGMFIFNHLYAHIYIYIHVGLFG